MKIDEGCINHNVIRLVDELVESRYEFIDPANPARERAYLLLTLGEIGGVLELARALKGVLKE